ncbi:hypothetical protein [Amycolatopsis sp. PS_44_ISF1]|uniref:hypothetical protein n=1 Tax=Amycolatopsis sp. PS_44_ISF1 TaxID=2974917 RepID=UPI0028DD7EB6|nr:hypothetical protein [Amycolatopsis sp. PS_44_ISF1]MDT8913667.1 hypothetical protein [Amycolatopsis sp. PS_44_ISF1]
MNAPGEPHPVGLPEDSRVPGRGRLAGRADYERYFAIVRGRPDLLDWTRTCLDLQDQVVGDLARTGLDPAEQDRLRSGLAAVNRAALTAWAGTTPPGDREPDETTPHPGLHRWKRGHQLFHLLLVQMCTTLEGALDPLGAAQWSRLARLVDDVTVLLDAATAAMSYAASFAPDAYRDEIRPTMEPPHLPPGLSGTLNAEHRAMTRLLRDLLKQLTATRDDPGSDPLPACLDEAVERLRAAQRRNWDNHARICSRCVPDGSSLLRSIRTGSQPKPPLDPAGKPPAHSPGRDATADGNHE